MSDLRERVARACAYAVEMQHSTLDVVKRLGFPTIEAFVDKAWPNYLPQADAAIALVLEEAAKVVEVMPRTYNKVKEDHDVLGIKGTWTFTLNNGPTECAAAIRALTEKSDE